MPPTCRSILCFAWCFKLPKWISDIRRLAKKTRSPPRFPKILRRFVILLNATPLATAFLSLDQWTEARSDPRRRVQQRFTTMAWQSTKLDDGSTRPNKNGDAENQIHHVERITYPASEKSSRKTQIFMIASHISHSPTGLHLLVCLLQHASCLPSSHPGKRVPDAQTISSAAIRFR